ncbi:unnamed protein product [Tuber aestivum]|uniref:Uncharacterized protein n=1 Tax=Tuber aestivum TaxID=59557 RepID=A0A292PM67_9PEZI|nr:unnamed protein product [Tuber aestivum]
MWASLQGFFSQNTQSFVSGNYSGNVNSNNHTVNHYYYGSSGSNSKEPEFHWMVAYSRNDTFTGRKDIIAHLKELLEDRNYSRVALYGLGGAGKTQIALEYVHQCKGLSHVFWVHGSSFLKFGEDYRRIFQTVGISHGGPEPSENEQLSEVKKWFESPASGSWIMILDNADNEADFSGNKSPVSRFVPQSSSGKIVITTRSRVVASRQGCNVVEVGKMPAEEARELFFQRFGSTVRLQDHDFEAVDMLLDALDQLPLAIAGASAFMTETQTLPSEYWRIFQESDKRRKALLSEQFCDIRREVDMTESILSTYFITFERIKEQNPKGADLLRLIAFFDRHKIPEELFLKSGLEGMDHPIEFRRAIGTLLSFSLVTQAEDTPVYELHRLVQHSIQVYLSQEEVCKWRRIGLMVVSRLFPHYEHNVRHICATYLPHALAIVKNSDDPLASPVRYRVSMYLCDVGYYSEAEIQIRRCIQLEADADEKDPGSLARYGLLAAVLQARGRYEEAEKIGRHVLEGRENALGPDHIDTLASVSSLALVLGLLGKHVEAERLNRRALEGRQKILGPRNVDTLASLSNLSLVLRDLGRYDEAESLSRRALEGREEALGPEHPDTLNSLSVLVWILDVLGKYDEGERTNQRALDARQRVLGPGHPDTLSSLHRHGFVLRRLGKYAEAEKFYRNALEGREKKLGPEHPDTLSSVDDWAMVLLDLGKYAEAEQSARRALEGYRKLRGPDHPSTFMAMGNLGSVLQKLGRYDEAETMLRMAVGGSEKVLGPESMVTLLSANNLALLLHHLGCFEESEKLQRRVFENREKTFGPMNAATLSSLKNLASVLRDQGKNKETEEMLLRALKCCTELYGEEHIEALTCAEDLALFLYFRQGYQEAENMQKRVLEGRKKKVGLDHPNTLISANNLAAILADLGRYEEAEKLCRWAFEGSERVLGLAHPQTLRNLKNLASLLQRAEESGEAVGLPQHPQDFEGHVI